MSNEMSNPVQRLSIRLSGGFLLLVSCCGFFCGGRALLALALAATVHELGHLAVILAQRCLPTGFKLDACGLCIRCPDAPGYLGGLTRALAGPAAGLGLALSLGRSALPLLRETAQLSLALSLINLLPASPLDGGAVLRCLTASVLGLRASGRLCLMLDCACILLTLYWGLCGNPPLLLYGLWLLLRTLRRD